MKPFFYMLLILSSILPAAHAQQQGQEQPGEENPLPERCDNCSEALPLTNGNFSNFNGPLSSLVAECTHKTDNTYPVGLVGTIYFSNSNLPNWYRIDGAPAASLGQINLRTGATNGASGGDWCETWGTQGVAAQYPFLKNAKYRITLGFDSWYNYVSYYGGVTVSAHAANGLVEPSVPSDIVKVGYTLPAGVTTLGTWQPAAYTSHYSPYAVSFCTRVFTEDKNQLYITASQHYFDYFRTPHLYAGQPAAFAAAMSYAKVEICNECPTVLYKVTNLSSPDPVTFQPFYAGGLFIDGIVEVDGATFTNNASQNTMLMGRYILTGGTNTSGNAFTATANIGKYFMMVPNNACQTLCGPISGPTELPCFSTIQLTASPTGGTWSSSNTSLATVGPTGGVTKTSPVGIGGTVTITYITGNCELTWTVNVLPCFGKPSNDQNSSLAGAVVSSVEIYPNPAQSFVTVVCNAASIQETYISIKDVSGRVLYSQIVDGHAETVLQHGIDISEYQPGIYFVDIAIGKQHTMKKLVKL